MLQLVGTTSTLLLRLFLRLEYNSITNSLKGRRLSEALARIEKDVHRADSGSSPSDLIEINAPVVFQSSLHAILAAYCAHDPEIEYVQGMCDLLAPLLSVIKDEYLTFWAFVSFMKRMVSQEDDLFCSDTATYLTRLQFSDNSKHYAT